MALVGLLPTSTVPPHPGPPIWADLVIGDDEVVLELQGEPEPLKRCLGLSVEPLGDLAPGPRAAVEAEISAWLLANDPITIDGVATLPEIRRLELPIDDPETDGWLTVKATLAWACPSPPRRVAFLWRSYEGTEWGGESYFPLLVKHAGDTRMRSVWEEEPEYVWHASDAPRPDSIPDPPNEAVLTGTSERGPLGTSGVVLLGAGALGLVASALGRHRARVPIALAVVGALLWAQDARAGGRVRLPAQEQALELFETLHRNVYAAFDATTEDGIYALLARSLDPAILDEQYAEIYESMILRDEGGAVSSIEEIEVLERAVTLEPRRTEAGPSFEVDWTWRVHGAVAHWGHIHRRTNHYRALYTVRHDGRAWRIADVRVQEHSRIED